MIVPYKIKIAEEKKDGINFPKLGIKKKYGLKDDKLVKIVQKYEQK